jgi:dTDP-4-amino-4,6-dideoxygalactose transaminase
MSSGRRPRRVPQTAPRAGWLEHRAELDAAIAGVIDRGRYILGPEVEAFEEEFARYLEVAHVVGAASGTDALVLALRALAIGPGDAVLTTPLTATATVAAIELAGAAPVLVDIDPRTYNIDPDRLEEAVRRWGRRRPRLRAIVPVHLYGQPADLTAILGLAARRGLEVIEDCAQAHGARWEGRRVGSFGRAAAFSFYPTKNLGALGDGGAVVTDDPALAERLRLLRQYGWRTPQISEFPGLNSRLDELQAAALRLRLRTLDQDNQRRRDLAGVYASALATSAVPPPFSDLRAQHVYHQFVVRTPARDELRARLAAQGIDTGIHYPAPIHRQPAYHGRLAGENLAQAERACREILSLPMYPQLPRATARRIGESIRAWAAERAGS